MNDNKAFDQPDPWGQYYFYRVRAYRQYEIVKSTFRTLSNDQPSVDVVQAMFAGDRIHGRDPQNT